MKKIKSDNLNRKFISVKGAKLHNLKNISVNIPHNSLTVISGVSGSGKSSLAFDTIYAEGQRRFVESLSAYARQFLERMGKPDVDSITGLPPAIAIEQKASSRNPRSTVGTSTEIYDYLRLLYGRIGETFCKNCGEKVKKDTPQSVTEFLLTLPVGKRLFIMFPLSLQLREYEHELKKFIAKGYFRIVLKKSYEIIDLNEKEIPIGLTVDDFYILFDRLSIHNDKESVTRLTESLESAFHYATGLILIHDYDEKINYKFSSQFECAECEIIYAEPEPRLFSFNNPHGACPSCQGFGRTIGIDEELVIPNNTKTLRQGAIYPFRTPGFISHQRDLIRMSSKYNIPLDTPIQNFSKSQKEWLWEGAGDYIGLNGFFKMVEENMYKMHYRVLMSRYRGYTKCKACGGSRIRTSARQVFINNINIPELIKYPFEKVLLYLNSLHLNEAQEATVGQVLNELKWRTQLMVDIGLHYLTLERLSHSLSGGESQRINLSTALGSSLVGTLYVLDEPSIGLHPRDTERLLNILFKLRNLGNTILVVEHDPEIIRNSDYLIDMGPKAGFMGGEVVYQGKIEDISKSDKSLTCQYLTGKKEIIIDSVRNSGNGNFITLYKPESNNLLIDKISFPLGCINVITGVSGSGKSSLIHDVLYEGLKKIKLGGESGSNLYEKIEGYSGINNVELVDQSSIGKSSRSTPVTYTKVFDIIRDLFASTQAAKQLGWKPGYFSFNVPGGRCDVCEGEGLVTIDMQFLPDVSLECEACKGTRYKREARNILYKGKSIVDVLNMTIDEAAKFFEDYQKIVNKLNILKDVGLGYLKLGQPSSMLSGGESQRIKLANHLEASGTNTLFIFDEPTTGLHLDDISKLLTCFKRLINNGHSIIIIEHNLHVIASSDWVIDLGPEAGEKGGKIVTTGTPEQVMKVKTSHTGKALFNFFNEK